MKSARTRRWTIPLAGVLLAAACGPAEKPEPGRSPPGSPREAYLHALEDAGLARNAVALDWRRAGETALTEPTPVPLPYREARYLAPTDPGAIGFRFSALRGQRVEVGVSADTERPHRVFIELFRVPGDGTDLPFPVASAEDAVWALETDIRRDGDYVVRIQPELFRGGRYTVTLRIGGSLAFPVSGRGLNAVQSRFGAPRDGGRRDHHGVDIFAPRGTPALAAAEGIVSRVDTTSRGGRVVWLRAKAGPSLYYAHLDQPMVRRGQAVAPGDTVGLIGNTGNARSTPPHLHFGIYQRGPLDPWPFLWQPPGAPPSVPDPLEGLGEWARVTDGRAVVRAGPSADAPARLELGTDGLLRIAGGSGPWYAARLPDGRFGYVERSAVGPATAPLAERMVPAPTPLRTRPAESGVLVDSLAAGDEVAVLGRFESFVLVRDERGREGWLAERLLDAAAPAAAQR